MTYVSTHGPCPNCASSDAYAIYESGVGHCFSCGTSTPPGGGAAAAPTPVAKDKRPLLRNIEILPLDVRCLSQATCGRYGYGIADDGSRKVQVAPYTDASGRVVAQKVRGVDKHFYVTGDLAAAGLFGQQTCRTSGKLIVITEGELDAMSIHQALGGTWPVVSVPNGAAGARAALAAQLEFLSGFERVVLAFDNDAAGIEAAEECVGLFPPGVGAVANMAPHKDASDFLVNSASKELREAVWNAREYRPDGIVDMADARARVEAPLSMGVLYPWQGLNDLLFGFRPGELVTWTAGTGVGKSAIVSEMVYHLISAGTRTGIVYLEEGLDRAGKRIVGLAMNKPLHLPDVEFTPEQFDTAWAATLGAGNLYAYDHFGSLDEVTLLRRIRFMVVACGCKVIVLDHISMVVSGADLDTDERRSLDHIMTALRMLTQETGASIHVVSHLRRPGGAGKSHEEGRQVSLSHLRGTQAIAQLSDAVIACERDQQAEDLTERSTVTLRVLKNRYSGMTGEACRLKYTHSTGRLTVVDWPGDTEQGGEPHGDY